MARSLGGAGLEGWSLVSRRFVWVDLIRLTIGFGIPVTVLGFLSGLTGWPLWWTAFGVVAAIGLTVLCFVPRRVRSIGYQLREDDLVFRRGVMFQRVVAVPYGRMQLIDVTRGPVLRAFGLSELRFVTAAATTAVVIPGLPEQEAQQLRDRLVAVAETRRVGL